MAPRAAAALLLVLAFAAPAAAQRLPTTVVPEQYDLMFSVDLARARFDGTETIRVQVGAPSRSIVLNALDIEFHDVSIDGQKATVTTDPKKETATFTVPHPLEKGPAEIHVVYTGRLNDKLRGFYLSKANNRSYAVTQFESTDARRAFPCFDEPSFKATFAITLVIDRGDTAISNGKLVSDAPGPTPTRHTLKFATSPKMSSYLVAMAVGDFQCLDGAQDGVPIRICATPDKKDLGHIALESAEQILKFYDGYFTIKYPYGKLDVVAVPDFSAGAMENTAAIFYRETELLADTKTASVGERKTIASVLAHEMAHQWFGDLVTMKWWDDLWLNEGFATWMANLPLAAWKPEWNVEVDAGLENQTALNLDSLKSTRAIRARVETPAEIEEAFDPIAYQKGAAVLRMIEAFVGGDTFKKGVNAYVQAHAYGNATSEDFWSAIAQTSGRPVDKIMPTFVNQPGVPLLTVSSSCPGSQTQVMMTQKRFLLEATPAAAGVAARWQIPVCFEFGSAKTTPAHDVNTCAIVDRAQETFNLFEGGCRPWVFANLDGRGYYRTEYSRELLTAMVPQVGEALSAPERLSLAGDEWALVRASIHTVGDYLTLASGYGREKTSGVLSLVVAPTSTMHQYLTTDATRPKFEAFVRSWLRPLFDEIGFVPKGDESDDRRELRAVVIATLGSTGQDPDIATRSRAALDRALAGEGAIDPTSAGAIVRVAAEHGDAKLYDALVAAAERAASPEEHYRYLYAVANFRDPALIDRALQLSLSPQLRTQDTAIFLSQFFANPAARPRGWAFLKEHWAALEPKIAVAGGDTSLVSSLSAFCDARTRDDIRAFFAAHKLPVASRTLSLTIERIDNCIRLAEKQTPALTAWLNGR